MNGAVLVVGVGASEGVKEGVKADVRGQWMATYLFLYPRGTDEGTIFG
jgi:hypothetical protein